MNNEEIVEILQSLAKPGAGYRTIWALNIAMAFFSENKYLPDELHGYEQGFKDGWDACVHEYNFEEGAEG